jgi:hypothetical protein
MAMEPAARSEFEAVVERARARAASTGELHPDVASAAAAPIPAELRDFVRQILLDGSYEREAARIGEADPDLATL